MFIFEGHPDRSRQIQSGRDFTGGNKHPDFISNSWMTRLIVDSKT